jgi:hypothetical protein
LRALVEVDRPLSPRFWLEAGVNMSKEHEGAKSGAGAGVGATGAERPGGEAGDGEGEATPRGVEGTEKKSENISSSPT